MIQKQRINILGKILYMTSLVLNYFFLKYTSSGQLLNSIFFWDLPLHTFEAEGFKLMIIRSLLAKCGLFLLIIVFCTIMARVLTQKIAPAQDEDPLVIKFLNRIIQNTLEQAAIFITMYTYFLFDKAGDKFNSSQLLVFASWFIWARVLFFITYSLGTLINMVSLRSFGMGVNLAIVIMVAELCFLPNHYLTNTIFSL